MRLFRMACCLLLLAALAAAQSATPSGPQSSDSQQPGQPPQSPLQEPPKDQQQQVPEPQRGKPSTFDVGAVASGAEDQELGEVRLMNRYTQIGGDPQGRARSFHQEGSNNLAEFNYFLDRQLFDTTHRFQMLSMFRGTDDSSIDPEHNSLQRAYLRLYGARDEYLLGDVLVNYSRLSFNQNVKGVSASWKLGQQWKLSTVGGVFIDRWGSLFKDQPSGCVADVYNQANFVASTDPQCGRPFTAGVAGARLEYAFTRDSVLGFNFSSSDDLTSTRRPLPAGWPADQPLPAPQPASNRVASLDFKWHLAGLRTDSEFAYSATDFDTRDSGGLCQNQLPDGTLALLPCDSRLPQGPLGIQGDWGARFEATYRWRKLSFRASYVRFQPDFASINARQIADLQDFLFRTSYDITNWLTLDGTLRRSNDDLKQQNPYKKVIWGPEGRFIFHDLSFYRRGIFEIGYRHRIIDGASNILPPTGLVPGCVLKSSGPGMVCVDRYLRSPYAEFTIPVSTTFLSLGYERRQSVDILKPGGTSNTNRVYAGLRGIYGVSGWHINPSLRFELERQTHRLDQDTYLALPPGQSQYLNALDLLMLDYDSNRLAMANLYMEAPRWFIVELAYRANSATAGVLSTVPAPCTAAITPPCQPGQAQISMVAPGPNGYLRPSYRVAVTYKLLNDDNKVLIFSFERNNNAYYSQQYPPGGLLNPINFDERIAGVTFVYKFGKRGR